MLHTLLVSGGRRLKRARRFGVRAASIWTVDAQPGPGHHERTSPILFVDGIYTESSESWAPYISFFSERGFNCSVLDLNDGDGSSNPTMTRDVMSVEGDIRAAIDQHIKAVPIIVAHSTSVSFVCWVRCVMCGVLLRSSK
jgi:hypothetical protein